MNTAPSPDQLALPAELMPADLGPVAPEPKPAAAANPLQQTKRGPGRPKGSKTDPRIKRATAKRTGKPIPDAAAEAAATALERETKAGRPSVTAKQSQAMQEGLQSFYVGVGALLGIAGQFTGQRRLVAGGAAAVDHGPACARALVAWSETNPAVRRALEHLTTAGGASLVLAAHAPIVAAVVSGSYEGAAGDEAAAAAAAAGSVETATGIDLGTLLGTILQG